MQDVSEQAQAMDQVEKMLIEEGAVSRIAGLAKSETKGQFGGTPDDHMGAFFLCLHAASSILVDMAILAPTKLKRAMTLATFGNEVPSFARQVFNSTLRRRRSDIEG